MNSTEMWNLEMLMSSSEGESTGVVREPGKGPREERVLLFCKLSTSEWLQKVDFKCSHHKEMLNI